MRGKYTSVSEFNEACENLNISITSGPFRVIILSMDIYDARNVPDYGIFDQIRDMLLVHGELFMLEYVEQFSYIIILHGKESSELLKHLQFIQQHYHKMTKTHITIGIGQSYDDISGIPMSCDEAKKAVKHRLTKGTHSIIYYSDISTSIDAYAYPKAELDGLYHAIANGNTAKIEYAIQSLIELFRKEYRSLFLSTCLCYDIINTALRAAHDLSPTIVFESGFQLDKTEFKSIDEFIVIIESIYKDIIKWLEGQKKKLTFDIHAISAYIRQHYSDPDFYIGNVAKHFEMSVSNLSHQFKSSMNQNISAYINNLRLETAKTLLSSTELTVNDIALRVGYYQTSSFIRKFKQDVGETPIEYRKRMNIRR